MLTTATRVPQAVITLPAMVKQAVDAMERQGKDPQAFISLLKSSGPHLNYMFLLEKNRLLNKICDMPKGDDRDATIAQAALLKHLIDTLEAIR